MSWRRALRTRGSAPKASHQDFRKGRRGKRCQISADRAAIARNLVGGLTTGLRRARTASARYSNSLAVPDVHELDHAPPVHVDADAPQQAAEDDQVMLEVGQVSAAIQSALSSLPQS